MLKNVQNQIKAPDIALVKYDQEPLYENTNGYIQIYNSTL